MLKSLKKRRVSTPDRKGVFGQGEKALRVGLYARVSTHDQKTLPCSSWRCGTMPKRDVGPFPSRFRTWWGLGPRHARNGRSIEAARQREIDLVPVWRLDRWGRSLLDVVNTLQELRGIRVPV